MIILAKKCEMRLACHESMQNKSAYFILLFNNESILVCERNSAIAMPNKKGCIVVAKELSSGLIEAKCNIQKMIVRNFLLLSIIFFLPGT
jgi:hypothetical protein